MALFFQTRSRSTQYAELRTNKLALFFQLDLSHRNHRSHREISNYINEQVLSIVERIINNNVSLLSPEFCVLYSVFIHSTTGNRKERAFFKKMSLIRRFLVLRAAYRVLRSKEKIVNIQSKTCPERSRMDRQ